MLLKKLKDFLMLPMCSNIPPKKIIQVTSREYKKFKKRYSEPVNTDGTSDNTILSQNVQLSMNFQKTHLNNNVLVVENGKQSDIVKQNILQANSNFVVVDPEGELLKETRDFLEKQGYKIKTIDFISPEESDGYNPFCYFKDAYDVNSFIGDLIQTNKSDKNTEPFWEDAKIALLQAIFYYLTNHGVEEEKRLSSVTKILKDCLSVEKEISKKAKSDADYFENETDYGIKSKLDTVYETIGIKKPDDFGYKAYSDFKKCGNANVRYSVINDCLHLLSFLEILEVEQITSRDTLDLTTFGNTKQAIFIIIPRNNNQYRPVIAMLYEQMYNILHDYVAESTDGKCYAFQTRFFINGFQNIGYIHHFCRKIVPARIYDMSYFIIMSNTEDLKLLYGEEDALEIMANCDSLVFYDNDTITSTYYKCFVLLRRTQVFVDNILRKEF